MKVLLVNPPSQKRYGKQRAASGIVHPIGLAYLASYLRRYGFGVKIIDAYALDYDIARTREAIANEDFNLFGTTSHSLGFDIAVQIIEAAKEANPNAVTMIGGSHPSALPYGTLQASDKIDVVVRREGEPTCLELAERIEKGKSLDDVRGTAVRTKDGRLKSNADRPLIKDVDSLPFPAFDLLPHERYRASPHHSLSFTKKATLSPYVPMFTSRGCPFACTFCASKVVWGRGIRYRSPENVLEEIRHWHETLGVKNIDFYDDTFTLNKPRAVKILKGMIDLDLDINWTCPTRVDCVDDEILHLMDKAGCYYIRYGVESGSPKVMKLNKKGITREKTIETFRKTREHNMARNAFFIFGHPGETMEDAEQTIAFSKQLDPDLAIFYTLIPLPGSEVEKIVRRDGLIENTKIDNMTFISENARISTGHLTPEQLVALRKRAYREFYLRPGFILKKASQIKTLDDIKLYFNGLRAFLGSV